MPITKQCIAIIGSSSEIVRSIVNALCRDNYRLLLFDEKREVAEMLSHEICSSVDESDLEVLDCTYQACWEADVILILNNNRDLKGLSEKIADVTTQKIIVILQSDERIDELEQIESFFPKSRVVILYPSKSMSKTIHLQTRHAKALDTVRSMISAAGFQPVMKVLNRDLPFMII